MQQPDIHPINQKGATRVSRRSPSPLAILKQLMDAATDVRSTDDRNAISDEFTKRTQSKEFTDIFREHWFTNTYRYMLRDYPEKGDRVAKRYATRAERQAAREQKAEQLKARAAQTIETKAEEKAQIILLDLVLPNGKPLRDCTGRECKEMSGTVGAWLQRIGKRVKAAEVVGNVLKEADVRKLYQP
jgi:hypothetical protein